MTVGQKCDRLQMNQVDHRSKIKGGQDDLRRFFAEIKGKFLKADVSDITDHSSRA